MKIYILLLLNLCLIKAALSGKRKENYNLKKPSFLESNENVEDNSNQKEHNDEFDSNEIMELESDFIISEIRWVKNGDYDLNYLLGIFEGANDPSFKDALPLAMIKGKLKTVNYIKVDTTYTYKYVRYILPNKNSSDISPVKIYGSKKLEDDSENNRVFQASNLPLLYIYTSNKTNPTQIYHKLNCSVLLINKGKIEINETAIIKLRGKSTAIIPTKKPYKLKFNKKQKILNFEGKFKNWALMANAFIDLY